MEESVITALNLADDIVLEEGEMTKSELKKLRKKMKMKRRERRMKVKEEKGPRAAARWTQSRDSIQWLCS